MAYQINRVQRKILDRLEELGVFTGYDELGMQDKATQLAALWVGSHAPRQTDLNPDAAFSACAQYGFAFAMQHYIDRAPRGTGEEARELHWQFTAECTRQLCDAIAETPGRHSTQTKYDVLKYTVMHTLDIAKALFPEGVMVSPAAEDFAGKPKHDIRTYVDAADKNLERLRGKYQDVFQGV